MKILFPIEYKNNYPFDEEDIDTIYYGETIEDITIHSNGLDDLFVLLVKHSSGESRVNYNATFDGFNNIHYYLTYVDCGFKSDNLKFLTEQIKKIEDLWNGR